MAERRAWFTRVHHHRHRVRITPATWQGWALFMAMLTGGITLDLAVAFAMIDADFAPGAVVAVHVGLLLAILATIVTICWRLSERIDP